jgi:pimeloyl-ACP methyl ester carboxylesterase
MTGDATRPLVLIRGFGGPDISGEQGSPYQGFNDGTVYQGKRGENYIYEGFLLRALKSDRYPYSDATNVIGYYASNVDPPADLGGWDSDDTTGTVVIDPQLAARILSKGVAGTIWVYRYYDLAPRHLDRYGEGLVRLLMLIRRAALQHGEAFDGVDVVAHSMGGLVLRDALRQLHKQDPDAGQLIHRIVTLGTPHRGIAFQRIPEWLLKILPMVEKAENEIAAFDPTSTEFTKVRDWFPLERLLTVVGTNYRTYGSSAVSHLNRVSSLLDEGSLEYNRSDGLVKQSSAQLPGAPRTFVNKCHGGQDGLVTSREAYEIAMRFFHGTHSVRLWLDDAEVKRGKDMFGKSEFYFGVSIKPRYVDFELFHQSADAENCYGAFHELDLSDGPPPLEQELEKPLAAHGDNTLGWAGPDRLIWQGWVDAKAKPTDTDTGLVFRLDLYVSERDSHGIGFSDNVIFHKQYYVQAFMDPLEMFLHTGEQFLKSDHPTVKAQAEQSVHLGTDAAVQELTPGGVNAASNQWTFKVTGTGFDGRLRVAIDPA